MNLYVCSYHLSDRDQIRRGNPRREGASFYVSITPLYPGGRDPGILIFSRPLIYAQPFDDRRAGEFGNISNRDGGKRYWGSAANSAVLGVLVGSS